MLKPQLAGIGLLVVIAAAAIGCNKDTEVVRAAEAVRAPVAEKARFETLVVPDGTRVVATLDSRLSTATSHSGDAFSASTVEPIMANGRTVFPAGSHVRGALRDVQASGRVKGRARMTLAYESISGPDGKTHAMSAAPLTLQAASATHGDVEKIAAGTLLGAIAGGISGGGKGAAIGAGAGASAGTILMLATKGDEVELESGQRLSVLTTSATNVEVLAQR